MLGKFGKFTLVERIAEGGMAEVFKATVRGPEGFERIVAIKRLHRALCEDADLTQMLVDEARIAVQLNHPNIANVFDLGCIENQYFIIMEYIDGTDMLHLLDQCREHRTPIPIQGALFAVTETLSGLHYAHTKLGRNNEPLGIVHRDVSPQNIMVTWDGRVKLVDFGIAKARNRAQTTQHGIIKGKFYYMAPEQAHGHQVDSRTDVYAAGMVLYEMLAGRSPYDDTPETELLRAVRRADFPSAGHFRPDLDPELVALVEVATQRNPDKRFSNAMEFQLALNDYRHRKLGAFAEPHMACTVAQIANASRSNDNFQPLDRGGYRPSEESLLYELPDGAARAAAGGGAIGNDNPFSDDKPTEIYGGSTGREHQLPPSPGARRQHGTSSNTHGELPSNRPHIGLDVQEPQRARPATEQSFFDRVAKPKYVYMAIALAALLVAALGAVLYFARGSDDTEQTALAVVNETTAGAAVATTTAPTVPTEIEVAFATTPSNAQVIIDGVDEGTTPVSVELEVGKSYDVEFVRDGYQVHEQEFVVDETTEELVATLVEAKGILKILSFPSDATVEIEGEEQGVTPLTLTGMETSETYKIAATYNGVRQERSVGWESESDDDAAGASHVREVMFEFKKAGNSSLAVNVDKIPTTKKRRRSPKRRQYRRKRTAPSKSTSSSSSGGDDLNVFGSSGSSKKEESSSSSSEEELDIWGGSKKKKTPKKKTSKPKEDDEDLDIW